MGPKIHLLIFGFLILAFPAKPCLAFTDTFRNIFTNAGNANSFFSSVFSNLNDFFKNVGKTIDAAIEKECEFKCPNGRKPRPNPYHVPEGNGCGVPGMQIPKYIPFNKLEKCCNEHDICYGTCNKNQQACDDKFKHCLYDICSSLKKYVSSDFIKGCKVIAKTLYTAVTAMGCKYYLDAQKEACICDENYRNEF